MTFAAGLTAGIIATVLAGFFVFRARAVAGQSSGRYLDLRALVGAVALIIAIVALVRSGNSGSGSTNAKPSFPDASTSTTVGDNNTTSTSTPTTLVAPEVSVPNVLNMKKAEAIASLTTAGFKAQIETLPLNGVPAGYVITQTPTGLSTAAPHSVVVLGVSGTA